MKYELPPKPRNEGVQMDIDFPQETTKEELAVAAKKYNIHESLLSKKNNDWFACNLPVEEYTKERQRIATRIELGDVNFLSMVDNHWKVLYHGNQLSIDSWKKEILTEKRRVERYQKNENTDDDEKLPYYRGQWD
ncbi:MAG: hypothetical protein WCI93_00690 [bacterium]